MFDLAARWIFPVHAVPTAGPLPEGAERIAMRSPDGTRFAGTRCRPTEQAWDGTLILGFGGNAWNAQDVATYLHEVFPAAEVVSYFFRGYAPSEGRPSADAIIADAPACFDAAVDLVKPKHVIAIGFSIGSGVAATLSAERPLDGLILVTPFDSLREVAQSFMPWLPMGPFFGHEIAAAEAIERSQVRTAIFGAANDEIVPRERTDALRKRVPNLIYDKTLEKTGHNSIYGRSAFQLGLREAADRLIS